VRSRSSAPYQPLRESVLGENHKEHEPPEIEKYVVDFFFGLVLSKARVGNGTISQIGGFFSARAHKMTTTIHHTLLALAHFAIDNPRESR
jgi:hypothetical protein